MMTLKKLQLFAFISATLSIFALMSTYFSDYEGKFLLACIILFFAYRRASRPLIIPRILTFMIVLITIVLLLLAVFILKVNPGESLTLFLIILILAKSLMLRKFHDYTQFMILSVIGMLAGGAVSRSDLTPILIIIYTIFAGYYLYIFHLVTEIVSYRNGNKPSQSISVPVRYSGWFRSFLAIAMMTCIIGALIFVLIPRKTGNWPFSNIDRRGLVTSTGFSQKIILGELRKILRDKTAVLRVKPYTGKNQSFYGGPLYLRGGVYSKYVRIGNSWQWLEDPASEFDTELAASPLAYQIQKAKLKEGKQRLWRIYYERPISANLFVIDRPLAISTRTSVTLTYNPYENVIRYSTYPKKGFSYKLYTEKVNIDIKPSKSPKIHKREKNKYLRNALPEGQAIDIKFFKSVLNDILGTSQKNLTQQQKASKIASYLKTKFGYTLDNTGGNGIEEPVLDFLRNRKKGHCEYFASAMTLLAKAAGMRARVVIGFKGGEFNSFGNYYLIRNCDAHAWSEVYLPQKGWTRFDPTPPARDLALIKQNSIWTKPFWDLVDLIQFSWADKLIRYDDDAKAKFLKGLQKRIAGRKKSPDVHKKTFKLLLQKIIAFFTEEQYSSKWIQMLHWVIAILISIFSLLLIRILWTVIWIISTSVKKFLERRWEKRFGIIWHCPVDFYRKVLLWLSGKGISRNHSETACEFLERIETIHPEIYPEMEFVTKKYLAARFGNHRVNRDEQEKLNQANKNIRKKISKQQSVSP